MSSNQERNGLNPKVHMSRLKGEYLFPLNASYIHYKGREYGDLAANISPTNENPFTNAPLKIYLVLRYDRVAFLHSKDTVIYNKVQ